MDISNFFGYSFNTTLNSYILGTQDVDIVSIKCVELNIFYNCIYKSNPFVLTICIYTIKYVQFNTLYSYNIDVLSSTYTCNLLSSVLRSNCRVKL